MSTEIIEPTQSPESGGGSDPDIDVVKQLTPDQVEIVLELVEYTKSRISMPEERFHRLWLYLTLALLLVLSLGTIEEGLGTTNHSETIVGGAIFTWMLFGVAVEMIKRKHTDDLDKELIADIEEFLNLDQLDSAAE